MEILLQDVSYGLRKFRRSPAFSVVTVITLALGIGGITAIFSIVDRVLLRDLPLPEPDRLVWIGRTHPQFNHAVPLSGPNYLDLRDQNDVLDMAAVDFTRTFTATGDGDPQEVWGVEASANFFRTLGVETVIGRGFLPGEDAPGHDGVVVLSNGYWKRRFGADAAAIGKTITLNQRRHTIVGVLPATFRYPAWAQVYVPIIVPAQANARSNNYLGAIGRLKPGVTLEQAQARMSAIATRLARQYPEDADQGIALVPLHDWDVARMRPAVLILFAAAFFILLIACVNVANLLLARAGGRHQEIAIRSALGCGRRRVVRQLMTESLVLGSGGAVLGLLVAQATMLLLRWLRPAQLPDDLMNLGVDARVSLFAAAVTLVTAIAFGLVPALQLARANPADVLKEAATQMSVDTHRRPLRGALVVVEVALSLVLLAGAGVTVRSFVRLLRTDPGYDTHNLLTFWLALPKAKYSNPAQLGAFYTVAIQRLSSIPGVVSVAISNSLPPSGPGVDGPMVVVDRPPRTLSEAPDVFYHGVTPAYFRTMQIPVLRGRAFNEQDCSGSENRVVVVNDAIAQRYFHGEEPVGKLLGLGIGDIERVRWQIIGVVANAHYFGWNQDLPPEVYVCARSFGSYVGVALRTSGDPNSFVAAARHAVAEIDKDLPLTVVSTMDERLDQSFQDRRVNMFMLVTFAAVAVLLAMTGIYGVVAHVVAQRRREIGIRMALGAAQRDVVRLVLRYGAKLVITGVVAGMLGAAALARTMSRFVYGIRPNDPATFGGVAVILIIVAFLACYIPARAAARVDPLVAIKHE